MSTRSIPVPRLAPRSIAHPPMNTDVGDVAPGASMDMSGCGLMTTVIARVCTMSNVPVSRLRANTASRYGPALSGPTSTVHPAFANCGPKIDPMSLRAYPRPAVPRKIGGAPEPGFGYAQTSTSSMPESVAAPRSIAQPPTVNNGLTVLAGTSIHIRGSDSANAVRKPAASDPVGMRASDVTGKSLVLVAPVTQTVPPPAA